MAPRPRQGCPPVSWRRRARPQHQLRSHRLSRKQPAPSQAQVGPGGTSAPGQQQRPHDSARDNMRHTHTHGCRSPGFAAALRVQKRQAWGDGTRARGPPYCAHAPWEPTTVSEKFSASSAGLCQALCRARRAPPELTTALRTGTATPFPTAPGARRAGGKLLGHSRARRRGSWQCSEGP